MAINDEITKEPVIIGITLLSVEEYEAAAPHINKLDGSWWLRTKGYANQHVMCVESSGYVNEYGKHATSFDSVRPALLLAPDAGFQVDDEFVFGMRDWTVIPGNYAICNTAFMDQSMPFDENDNNNYETSNLRNLLLGWFERNKNGKICKKVFLADAPEACYSGMGRFMESLRAAGLQDDPALRALLDVLRALDENGYTKAVKKRLNTIALAMLSADVDQQFLAAAKQTPYATSHSGINMKLNALLDDLTSPPKDMPW